MFSDRGPVIGWEGAIAIVVLGATYALIVWREPHRLLIAGLGAAVVLILGLVPIGALAPTSIDGEGSVVSWNTLALLLGLFLLTGLLSVLGVFRYLAAELVRHSRGRPAYLYVSLALLAAGLSAVLSSLAVIVFLAVLTLEVCRSVRLNPVPFLLLEIAAANAGSIATTMGNPPNVILGGAFGLGLTAFLVHVGPIAVAALALALGWIYWVTHHDEPSGIPAASEPLPELDRSRVAAALGALLVVVGLLVVQVPLAIPIWVIGLVAGLLALAIAGTRYVRRVVREIHWDVLFFFLALFILVGGLEYTGVLTAIGEGIAALAIGSALVAGIVLLWSLGLLSALIDSVPLAAASTTIISTVSASLGVPVQSLVWATAAGTGLGGNATPIGAPANVIGVSTFRRAGRPISWRMYVRVMLPLTLLSLGAATGLWVLLQ